MDPIYLQDNTSSCSDQCDIHMNNDLLDFLRLEQLHIASQSSDSSNTNNAIYNTNLLHKRYFHSEPHRHSPSFDQGYHTLLNSSPTQPRAGTHHIKSANLTAGIIAHKLRTEQRNMSMSSNSTSLCSITKPSTFYSVSSGGGHHRSPLFDILPNEVIVKIFQWMNTYELCNLATVCRRFEKLIWSPLLWKKIVLRGDQINGDRALGNIVRRLCQDHSTCNVERVLLSEGCKITDKGLQMISRRCPNITHLQIQFSTMVSNQTLFDFVSKCTNLQHLDITGCNQITSINLTAGLETPRKLLLQYVDLTDCASIDDGGLKTIVKNCPLLIYLYLRRCLQITDAGIKLLPKFCIALKELSVSDCINVTDFGMYELAKLGATLRYLSVAKSKVSDVGLKYLARRCYKLRYLNSRGCEAISDDSITILARSCPRLRALDIGNCDVSNAGLFALAESCPNLKKLSLKNCDMISDDGIQYIAYYCRGLQQLNIQDCQITIEGYRAVKKYCKRCVIEHTNPSWGI